MVCVVCVKQKTADEMRSSDWSSDVCSSDLAAFSGVMREAAQLGALIERTDGIGAQRTEAHCGDVEDGCWIRLRAIIAADMDAEGRRVEIGRASCRERVCQYV